MPPSSVEAALRAALAGFQRDADPEAVRAALAAAGLRLSASAVRAWLAELQGAPEAITGRDSDRRAPLDLPTT